jgi:hypothetical protein
MFHQGPVESQDTEVRDHLFLFYCNVCELVGPDSSQVPLSLSNITTALS